MCGIAGCAGEHRERVERMTKALLHRGPDGNAVEVTNGATLGHARLAILDPRPEGDQPMWNADRSIAIVYNGEIFNYRTLREELGGQFKTTTDTEVLLRLYEREGMAFVPRLLGMFAFGIYDVKGKTWHLARDSSGIKPLYLAYPAGQLHFASEMRALLKALPSKPKIDETSLSLYLRLQYVPGPRTLCEGIQTLPPGTILTWHEGKERRATFTPVVPRKTFGSKGEFRETFPSLMDEVVKDHLVSDKPVGIFLSGGMDSSILLHHMSRHAKKPLRTFTVRFETTESEGSKRFNTDAELASLTAKHYETEHHEITLGAEEYRSLFRETAQALDQPNADSVSVAQHVLSRAAKKHVDVILSGAGGDELFGGYPRYRIAHILNTFRSVPSSVRGMAGKLLGYPEDILRMNPGPALAERLLTRPAQEIANVAKGDWFNARLTTSLFEERFEALPKADPVRAFMEFDRHLWLIDEALRLTDGTTMGGSVEARVPFLDPRVIEASHGTKSGWHVGLRGTKMLLKETYRPLLPEHLYSLSKASFYLPLAKWIRREASPLIEEMIAHPRIAERFDTVKLRAIFEAHKRKEIYALHLLSTLLHLQCWFDTVYDDA
jgi:asparagine synthase (glutamine-hydrolysing)